MRLSTRRRTAYRSSQALINQALLVQCRQMNRRSFARSSNRKGEMDRSESDAFPRYASIVSSPTDPRNRKQARCSPAQVLTLGLNHRHVSIQTWPISLPITLPHPPESFRDPLSPGHNQRIALGFMLSSSHSNSAIALSCNTDPRIHARAAAKAQNDIPFDGA